jgi:hypothetical protein
MCSYSHDKLKIRPSVNRRSIENEVIKNVEIQQKFQCLPLQKSKFNLLPLV